MAPTPIVESRRTAAALADVSLSAGLAGAAAGVAVVIAVTAVFDVVLAGPHRWALGGASLVAAAAVGAMAVWHAHRGFSARAAGHLAGACAVLCALDSVGHLALTLDPLQATYLVLCLIGSGAVLSMARWLVAVDAVVVLGYAPLAATRLEEASWGHFAVALAVSIAVAHVLRQLRARGEAQVQLLTDALAEQARRDQLTGLLNRRGLAEAVPELLEAGSGQLGVLCLDVDGFKRINDELGHSAGDMVLAEIAERLAAVTRASDVLVRLGGDEFALIAPGADAEAVDHLGDRLRIKLSGTAGVLGLPWAVSIGTAAGSAREQHDVERLLATADIAMYDDKQVRRSRWQTAPDVAGGGDRDASGGSAARTDGAAPAPVDVTDRAPE